MNRSIQNDLLAKAKLLRELARKTDEAAGSPVAAGPPEPANPFSPSADPRDSLEYCELAIRAEGWFDDAGIVEHWPLSTAEAVQLLAAAGYDVDLQSIEDLIRRGIVAAPAEDDSGPEWNAQDLARATAILECRGQWCPTPSIHDCKKHASRLFLERSRIAGTLGEAVRSGPVQFDLRHLLQLLVLCQSIEGRLQLAALLEGLLEVEHGVFL